MTFKKYIGCLLVLLCFLFQETKAEDFSFVVLGHGYPITHNHDKLERLVEEVNALNPKYVFVLGDFSAYEDSIFNGLSQISSKVLFSPGNHDLVIDRDREKYLDKVGYLDTTFQEGKYNFVLLNSSESVENINTYLAKHLNKADSITNLLFCHHRIWTDNRIEAIPYGNNKSYLFQEISKENRENMDYIFAGNVNRIQSTYQNCIYTSEMIEGITAFSCGMGLSKLSFVEFKYIDEQLYPIAHYIPYEGDHVYYDREQLKEKRRTYNTIKKGLIFLFASIAFLELLIILYLLRKRNAAKKDVE